MSVEILNMQACMILIDLLKFIVPMFLFTFVVGSMVLKLYDGRISQRDVIVE